MFLLLKTLGVLFSPAGILFLLLGSGVVLQFCSCPKWAKRGRFLCAFATLCFFLIAIFPLGSWALVPLENRFAFDPSAESIDGIILLGGDENINVTQARHMPTALDSMRRYAGFVELAKFHPNAKLLFSGRSPFAPADSLINDTDIARQILLVMGAPVDRMAFEQEARNTYENAVFSANLMHPEANERWLLVTSASHMPRAMGCFRKAGWNVTPAPTGYFTTGHLSFAPVFRFDEQMRLLTMAMHEYMGLVVYRIMGRTDALWPG